MLLEDDDINGLMEDITETVYFFPLFGGGEDFFGVWAEGIPIEADYNEPYETINLGQSEVASALPSLRVKTEDVPELMQGDWFRARGVMYEVTTPEPDGLGFAVLRLKKS